MWADSASIEAALDRKGAPARHLRYRRRDRCHQRDQRPLARVFLLCGCSPFSQVNYKFDRWLDLVFMQLLLN